MNFPETLKKRWYVLIGIPGIIILLIYFGLVFMIHDPVSTIFIYELNSSHLPQKNSISLTEEDFKVFPKLAPVIRDKTQKAVALMDDARLLYRISLYDEDERYTFTIRYGSSGFFVYKGKYYSYGLVIN